MAVKHMTTSLTESIDADLEKLLNKYGKGTDALMPIMQEMNYKYGNLSEYIIMQIATAFDISATEIYGTATFYHFLRTSPVGKYIISVSNCIPCEMKGSKKIVKVLKNELGIDIGQTTADGNFTLEEVSCIGLCDQAPAMLINEKAYTNLTPEKVIEILKEYR